MNETLITNDLWEEKNLIEPTMKFENSGIVVPRDIINETKNEFVKTACDDIGNKKKWKKICNNCGIESYYASEEYLKRNIKNNRSCLKCGSFKQDRYVGMKFGALTIIKQYNTFSPCNSKIVKVDYKCDCGNITSNKRFGCVKRQRMCLECRNKNEYKIKNPGKSAFNKLYHDYQSGAENRRYEFKLTTEEFEILTRRDCHYCGESPKNIKKARGGKEIYVYNGIDRVDSNKGYTIDNCVACCKLCNFSKMSLSINDFLSHIRKIYEYNFVGNRR
jgi:hypothetical protein